MRARSGSYLKYSLALPLGASSQAAVKSVTGKTLFSEQREPFWSEGRAASCPVSNELASFCSDNGTNIENWPHCFA